MRPRVSHLGLTFLCSPSFVVYLPRQTVQRGCLSPKVWMPSGPGADQLFAFFKAFLSLASSKLLRPLEEVLPTHLLVSFSQSFAPMSFLLTLPTVPRIFVQKSLTISIEGTSLEVGRLQFIRNFFGYSQGGFFPGIACVQLIFVLVGPRP